MVNHEGLSPEMIRATLAESLSGRNLKKALIVPPDMTRANSGAGLITRICYDLLGGADILPALGTHAPTTRGEQTAFFGGHIPESRYLVHDWRGGVTKIGEIPGDFVREVSEGLMDKPIGVEISDYLLDSSYSLILSVGQVVPHEVAGMANYTKNIAVGCGGADFISSSHMLGAFYGMERIMGRADTPVRRVLDYAQEHMLSGLPVLYIMTVVAQDKIIGLFIGEGREEFARAAALSREHNINYVSAPLETCVAWLDGHEFKSAWLANKAIYRARMAMADGGRLIILAPGVSKFGEDSETDRLIRRYGYSGRENILKLCKTEPELQANLSAAAHLIHGSADGRFSVTYATRHLSRAEVEGVGFAYMSFDDAVREYQPESLKEGYNTSPGGPIYYIANPALGLWALEGAF